MKTHIMKTGLLAAALFASTSVSHADVSNIGFHTGITYQFVSDQASGPNRVGQDLANSFTTGTTDLALQSITVSLAGGFGNGLSVSLYDGTGSPGSLLQAMTLVGDSTLVHGGGLFDYIPSSPYTMSPNTTYWAVFTVPHTSPDKQFPIYTVSNLGQTGSGGWSIGDNFASRPVNNGTPESWIGNNGSTPLEFAVNTAAAVPEPSTFAMFVGSFGALCFFMRRRS